MLRMAWLRIRGWNCCSWLFTFMCADKQNHEVLGSTKQRTKRVWMPRGINSWTPLQAEWSDLIRLLVYAVMTTADAVTS
jgi:hypothetical protein